MSQRHPIQNDAIMLITTNIAKRTPLFIHAPYAYEAIETLYRVQERYLFFIYGFVIMPDHCHFLLFVPAPGSVSKIMNIYKGITSANIGLGHIWQKRFHLKIIHNANAAIRYIHNNPIKKGLAVSPQDYPWSSASEKWDTEALPY